MTTTTTAPTTATQDEAHTPSGAMTAVLIEDACEGLYFRNSIAIKRLYAKCGMQVPEVGTRLDEARFTNATRHASLVARELAEFGDKEAAAFIKARATVIRNAVKRAWAPVPSKRTLKALADRSILLHAEEARLEAAYDRAVAAEAARVATLTAHGLPADTTDDEILALMAATDDADDAEERAADEAAAADLARIEAATDAHSQEMVALVDEYEAEAPEGAPVVEMSVMAVAPVAEPVPARDPAPANPLGDALVARGREELAKAVERLAVRFWNAHRGAFARGFKALDRAVPRPSKGNVTRALEYSMTVLPEVWRYEDKRLPGLWTQDKARAAVTADRRTMEALRYGQIGGRAPSPTVLAVSTQTPAVTLGELVAQHNREEKARTAGSIHAHMPPIVLEVSLDDAGRLQVA